MSEAAVFNSSKDPDHSWFATFSMGLAAGFLLAGYECIRSTANTLFKGVNGVERLPVIMAFVPAALFLLLYVYGRLLSRSGPRKTLRATSLLSSLAIFACFGLYESGWKPVTWALFVLRDSYIVIVLEQYWSFMVSTLKPESAKKCNGVFCGIASIGSILGASVCGALSVSMGTSRMLIFAACSLLPAMFFAEMAYRRCGEPARALSTHDTSGDHLGLTLFRARPLLLFLLLIIIVTQGIAAVLELGFQTALHEQIPKIDDQNAFSGWFFFWLNLAAAFGQFVVAPLCLSMAPLMSIHAAIPVLNGLSCVYFLAFPSLTSAGIAYLIFKTLDYSVFRAAKEILYIPLSYDIRYRSKELIDVLGYRFGKGGASLGITFWRAAGGTVSFTGLGGLAFGGAVIWLGLLIPIFREIAPLFETSAQEAEQERISGRQK